MPAEHPTLSVLQKIQSGELTGKGLDPESRRQVVMHLLAEGYSIVDISQILGLSDKTIRRDKRAIQQDNAIVRDPTLVERMVGQLVNEADNSIHRIRKVSRDRETPPSVKVEAERHCYQICSDLFQRLQDVGYLPKAAQQIHAEVMHMDGGLPTLAELEAEVLRLQSLETGGPVGDMGTALFALQEDLHRAKLAERVAQLPAAAPRNEDDHGVEHEPV